jgi:hypothetical protein
MLLVLLSFIIGTAIFGFSFLVTILSCSSLRLLGLKTLSSLKQAWSGISTNNNIIRAW